ncbi:protein of unknown function [Hyphomicrobium sp. 1Nfss2.1]|uniref:hypothetical protein n=1 Tax=Hyphomicrobium sp. 1Nfss2.1 TaxID=3413936 RepID=UPI003C7AF390
MILGTGIIGGAKPVLVYNDLLSDLGQNLTSVTVNSVPFGDEHSSRRVFAMIGVGMAEGSSISGVTIGGVTATQHVQAQATGSPAQTLGIFSALVPTGTTGTIFWTRAGSGDMDGAGVFCLSSYYQRNAAAHDTASDVTGGSGSAVVDVNVKGGGFVLGLAKLSSSRVTTWSLSGSDAALSFLPEQDVSTDHQMAGLSGSQLSAASPMAVRLSFSNSFGGPFKADCVAASFR